RGPIDRPPRVLIRGGRPRRGGCALIGRRGARVRGGLIAARLFGRGRSGPLILSVGLGLFTGRSVLLREGLADEGAAGEGQCAAEQGGGGECGTVRAFHGGS